MEYAIKILIVGVVLLAKTSGFSTPPAAARGQTPLVASQTPSELLELNEELATLAAWGTGCRGAYLEWADVILWDEEPSRTSGLYDVSHGADGTPRVIGRSVVIPDPSS